MKKKPIILVVDDVATNRQYLAMILGESEVYDIRLASNGKDALEFVAREKPDLILLDIMMPEMDGYEVASRLKEDSQTNDIPILFITAVTGTENIVKAFDLGGVDYINKPFNKQELMSRVSAHLNLRLARIELEEKNLILKSRELQLMELVDEKTKRLDGTVFALVNALENANLFNDTDTGDHIARVGAYAAHFAREYGCDEDYIKRIKLYSSLHDVGKVGIPDKILKKPGKYTPEEFIQMQEHVVIGSRMLDNPAIDIMAKNITLYHHEKWDGSGYVRGISGEDIPLEARIVAISDVYDALSTKRPYKEPFPEEQIDKIILEGKGSHFDPRLVDIFFRSKKALLEIQKRFSE
ncbi:HD-GYP domain-containing protein [Spirochaeta isovalerica]|uniref:Putative two-component system response regulator n=1 Tax=Spirochaeta isovalerica TaxID=150 RepID=A0A841RFY4_9SPIO|nr:response regulator [Spirochaeta isovalerica]MBB6481910.1 putative two-component system response regulator [Spirochaeta isovalerica]